MNRREWFSFYARQRFRGYKTGLQFRRFCRAQRVRIWLSLFAASEFLRRLPR